MINNNKARVIGGVVKVKPPVAATTTTTTVTPTTTTTTAPTTTTAAPGVSVPAYFVSTNASYGGKYCEDGTFDGKPKYRKTGTNYYMYWLNPDYGWAISDDLGNINPNVVAANSGGDTPPTGSFAFMDYNTGSDLGVFSSFYSTSATATFSNTYIHFGNTYNGKPKYNLVGGGLLAQYESQRSVWAIIDEEIDPSNPVVLYENSSNSNTLPLTGWVVADGNSPAPTLTGPTCGETTTTTTTTVAPTTTTTAAPLVGYTLSGSEDFSGNYTISGTYNEAPAWQHETKNYLMYFVSESTGWSAFPGTIAGGPSAGPLTFQACGYPCGGGGTCTVGAIIGDYCGQGDYDGYTFTITQAGGTTTTTVAPTTTTAAPTTTTAAPTTTTDAPTTTTAAPGAGPVVTLQPQNAAATTYSQSVSFTVAATGSNLSYQWQYYGTNNFIDDYDYAWRPWSDKTTATMTTSAQNVTSETGNSDFDFTKTVLLRCAVTSAGGDTVYSNTARFVDLPNQHGLGISWSTTFYNTPGFAADMQTLVLSEGETLIVDLMDYQWGINTSWFSGNNTTLRLQVADTNSANDADWTTLRSEPTRGHLSLSTDIPVSTGVKYYRITAVSLWPYTTNDGSSSAALATPFVWRGAPTDTLQVTWPSAPTTTTTTTTTTAAPTTTTTTTTTTGAPISPLSLANGFLSALHSDTVNDSEFPNAALANGYLSVLRVNDTISEAEFPNAALANGYIDVLRNDSITYNVVNAPANLTATSVELNVILAWTAPNNTSSSLMNNYIVEYTPSGGSAQTVNTNSANTSYTITGLTNGVSYTFRVAGVNNGSVGTYTASSSAVTIPNIPSAPRNLTASPTCCGPRINVSWSAPTSNGGFAITGYRVQISGGGFSVNQVVSGTSLESPDNGNYGGSATVSVRAINSAGESPLTSTIVSWNFGD